jgi:hypothetical protein
VGAGALAAGLAAGALLVFCAFGRAPGVLAMAALKLFVDGHRRPETPI